MSKGPFGGLFHAFGPLLPFLRLGDRVCRERSDPEHAHVEGPLFLCSHPSLV